MKWDVKALEESEFFLLLGTENYFKDPECFEMVRYAIELKKPVILFLKKGVTVPNGWLEGASILERFEWETPEEMHQAILELRNKRFPEGAEAAMAYGD
jgi:hypothetical protein